MTLKPTKFAIKMTGNNEQQNENTKNEHRVWTEWESCFFFFKQNGIMPGIITAFQA